MFSPISFTKPHVFDFVGQFMRSDPLSTWEFRGQLVSPKKEMGAYFFGTSIPSMKVLVDLDRDLR